MRISGLLLAFVALAESGLVFEDSRSDKIRANLENVGYEIVDSAGLVKDGVIESLDPQGVKEWLEVHGITGDAASSAIDTALKHKDWLLDDIKQYAESGHASAVHLLGKGKEFYNSQQENVLELWSDSRLKEFLDARGVPVPQSGKRDELLAAVSRIKHNLPPLAGVKGPSGRYWFDGWNREELTKALNGLGRNIDGSRRELVDRLHSAYIEGAAQGSSAFSDFKEAVFDSWSLDDLKEYLSEFGDKAEGTKDELVTRATNNWRQFVHSLWPSPPPKPKSTWERVSQGTRDYLSRILGLNFLAHGDL